MTPAADRLEKLADANGILSDADIALLRAAAALVRAIDGVNLSEPMVVEIHQIETARWELQEAAKP